MKRKKPLTFPPGPRENPSTWNPDSFRFDFDGWQVEPWPELDLKWDWEPWDFQWDLQALVIDWPGIDWPVFEWEPLVIDWDFSGGVWTIPDTKTADKQVKTGKGRKPHANREKR